MSVCVSRGMQEKLLEQQIQVFQNLVWNAGKNQNVGTVVLMQVEITV